MYMYASNLERVPKSTPLVLATTEPSMFSEKKLLFLRSQNIPSEALAEFSQLH